MEHYYKLINKYRIILQQVLSNSEDHELPIFTETVN